jgi:glycerol-3-phosphate dehydrogenase
MPNPEHDVLVIGAGIQGAGVAQAVTAAGWSALVLDRREAASGTSSKSSKLIHGGLRYLETFQLKLVRESLRERATLLRIAPHLVRLVPFSIPVYGSTSRGPWKVRAGLSLYSMLGGLGKDTRFDVVPKAEWPLLDGLQLDGLRKVFRYYDGQTHDAALTRAVLASAQNMGAVIQENTAVVALQRTDEAWKVQYRVGADVHETHARFVVNAAGPWVNRVLDMCTPGPARREIELVAGTHIELTGQLVQGGYYAEAPQDGRAVFTLPWQDRILVGTTERVFDGDPADIGPSPQEIDYLLAVHKHYFPGHVGEVVDAWSGLRVLPRGNGRAFSRPRDVTLVPDQAARPSFLSIYGGKLTGYRATAAKVERHIAKSLKVGARQADTSTLMLPNLGEF